MTEATTKTETASASDYTVLLANIQHNLLQLDSAVSLLEPRFTTRALRALAPIRTKLGKGGEQLAEVIRDGGFYPTGSERLSALITALGNPSPPSKDAPSPPPAATTSSTSASMDIDAPAPSASTSTAEKKDDAAPPAGPTSAQRAMALAKKKQDETLKEIATRVPEADAYLAVLTVVSLLDQGKIDEGKVLSTSLIEYFTSLNRRTLDQLTSKLYFYWVRLHELSGDDTGELRGTLLSAIRTATLRHDVDLQATLLPLLLRNYLDHGLYEQADRLVSKTVFPEGTAQNAQLARWFYYVGRIRAIQLNYTAAHSSLLQAIRRAPSDMSIAPGFFQHAYKLAVVVELLMGEIPERKTFREEVLKKSLRGYLEVAQAVRIGDIQAFNAALTSHTPQFTHDRTLTLIHRLRHTVIKTALRTLSLAYSRISLADISSKLALDSEEDAEYVVAKAIRDGVVSAKVDHEKGEMRSRELGDVYATGEPSREFDRRIQFLLELHNQSVKSMRYPLNAHSKELASADEARERERELAKEIEEGDEDADLDGAGDMDSF